MNDLNKINNIYQDSITRILSDTETLNTWQWAEKHIYLGADTDTPFPGKYKLSNSPFWKLPFEWYSDPTVRNMTIVKGVQLGGTLWMQICQLYAIAKKRRPIMYIGQTEGDVKEYSELKFSKLEKYCKPVMELKPKINAGNMTSKKYLSCSMLMGWGSSANSIASKTIGDLFLDEIDKYVQKNKKEASSLKLALRRVDAYRRKEKEKVLATSTPTVVTGDIWQRYIKGTMHVLQYTCPNCSELIELQFDKKTLIIPEDCRDGKKWKEEDVKEKSYYCCQLCKGSISNEQHLDMMHNATPVQTNPYPEESHYSLHLGGFNHMTFGQIAVEFIRAYKTADGLRDFYNNVLGLPFREAEVTNTNKTIEKLKNQSPVYNRITPRSTGNIIIKPFVVVTAVDVQLDHVWAMQAALNEDGDIYVISWAKLPSFEEAESYALRDLYHDGALIKPPRIGIIDSGYKAKRTGGVYEFVVSRSKMGWYPARGNGNKMFHTIQKTVTEHRGSQFELTTFSDMTFKDLLYNRLLKGNSNERLYLPQNIDDQLIDQLTDEKLVEIQKDNEIVHEWKNSKNNHLGDCLKMILVLWQKIENSE